MDHKEIIKQIGVPELMEATGSSYFSVSQWKRRGIPAKFWLPICRKAEAMGIQGVTMDCLHAGSPQGWMP